MASLTRLSLVLLLSFALLLPSSLAEVICEQLPQDLCSFAVSSSSKRCVLESWHRVAGKTEYQCRTSEVLVERMSDWIETDECVRACGLDRNTVGISSDTLLEAHFAAKLCSPACYQNCPNIVDLYFNLAAGEGAFLPDLCQAHRLNPHRSMVQLMSSGTAPAPATSLPAEASLPTPSPSAEVSSPAPAPSFF